MKVYFENKNIVTKYKVSKNNNSYYDKIYIDNDLYCLKTDKKIYDSLSENLKEEYYNPEKYKIMFFLVYSLDLDYKEYYPFLFKEYFILSMGNRFEIIYNKEHMFEELIMFELCLRKTHTNRFEFFERSYNICNIYNNSIVMNNKVKKINKNDFLYALKESTLLIKSFMLDIESINKNYIYNYNINTINKKYIKK